MNNTKIVLITLEIEDFNDTYSDAMIEEAVEAGINELMVRRGIAEPYQISVWTSFD